MNTEIQIVTETMIMFEFILMHEHTQTQRKKENNWVFASLITLGMNIVSMYLQYLSGVLLNIPSGPSLTILCVTGTYNT